MRNNQEKSHYKAIVIGAGQTGLSAGYYLAKKNIPFLMLDANERIGDAWRTRWDTLRLFTPAKFDGLAGMPFPASPNYFPTKDEMADFLENYAANFKLPVKTGVKVDGLSRDGNLYTVRAGDQKFTAEHVVVAMSNYQVPKIPKFSNELNKNINQFHSLYYRDASQFAEGDVLVVGAGNSGCEIALEAAKNGHKVWLSGRDVGKIPFNIAGTLGKLFLVRLVLRVLFHRILTTGTPLGRKARPKIISQGGPLIRIKEEDLEEAGIERVPKVKGLKNGIPQLEDEQILDVKNVIWCTGFHPSFSWIDIPIFKDKEPMHDRGIVENEPGLYFAGLHFLYSLSSTMVHGAQRDAQHIADRIAARAA